MTITTTPTFDSEATAKALNKLVRETEEDLHQRLAQAKKALGSDKSGLKSHLRQAVEALEGLQHTHAELSRRKLTEEKWAKWLEEQVAQIASAWVLSLTFVRYLEDHQHLRGRRLSGATADSRAQADNRRKAYFQQHPEAEEREYLQSVVEEMAGLPGCKTLFGAGYSPFWLLGPTGDGARALWLFFREFDPETGELQHDFRGADTRFLGDLYQNLSKKARERYALLQTPDFVEQFILDHTLKPAWETFGPEETKLIDPACGSGHFLLGAFWRIFETFRAEDARTSSHLLAQKALDRVFGVDLNPFAVAIARFRLLLAALEASGETDLAASFHFELNLAVGDSLLCGTRFDETGQGTFEGEGRWGSGAFTEEEYEKADAILSQSYEAVVGNPPYITDKDRAHRERVRSLYTSASGKFSLAVPFTQRFFDLATELPVAGFVGMITANSFMKREFGKTFVEHTVPGLDLTHVIDTSTAYIPGHGTPTVILFGRHQKPVASELRAVLGIRGEPGVPDDPKKGKVWHSIATLTDGPEAENKFVTVANLERKRLESHPWSLAGGGAMELMDLVGERGANVDEIADSIGFASFTGQDEVFLASPDTWERLRVQESTREFIYGGVVRDWCLSLDTTALVPYDDDNEPVPFEALPQELQRFLWPFRASLGGVLSFGGKTKAEDGQGWWLWYRWVKHKLDIPLSLTFAFVATHNHFVLDRGGKVFNRSAPVIKLPAEATEEDYLKLSGLLNSSLANFIFRQTCFPKGGDSVGTEGARVSKNPWEDRLERSGTAVGKFPLAPTDTHLLRLAQKLDALGQEKEPELTWTAQGLEQARRQRDDIYAQMVLWQEELDWHVYNLYGLSPESPELSTEQLESASDRPEGILPGERAFEIVLARLVAEGVENDTWFTRHGITPITEVPSHWPAAYRELVEERVKLIETERFFGLLEGPVHKRRWSRESFEALTQRKLEALLLKRLESPDYWPLARLQSTAQLAETAARDAEFCNWAALYTGEEHPEISKLVEQLAGDHAVPYLDSLVYKPSGLRKRAQWLEVWELQRAQDEDPSVDVPVPPKYTQADFQKGWYSHRGKLDVPQERFILYPDLQKEGNRSSVIGWAGWDHAQRAEALATAYQHAQMEGWEKERLVPQLRGLQQLVPWLKQWHNDLHPEMGLRLGDFYEGFVAEEARKHDLTLEEV